MAKNIRSKYIKNLISESKGITDGLEEITKEALKDILSETVNEQFRSILAEADDDFDEEEVDAEVPETGAEDIDAAAEEPEVGDGEAEAAGEEPVVDEPEAEGEEVPEEDPEKEEIWNSLEQYKNEDGEYDLTGMDGKEAARVLKVMDPDKDAIRVVQDGNRIELKDDDAGTEYVIELEPEEEEEDVFEIVGESKDYMDDYQKKTAMTTPDVHEPSPMKGYRDWDKGAPRSTDRPWAPKGDGQPYKEEVNEEINEMDVECGKQEATLKVGNGRGVGQRSKNWKGQGTPREKRHREDTGVNPSANEAIKRKANEVFLENRELKKVAGKIKDKLEESYLLNYNLGRVVKIITENATTREEKIDIVNRFSETKSIEESNRLYETISKELSSSKKTADIEKSLNGPITEARSMDYKPSVIETSMYRSEDLHETLDLMERMDRLGKK